MVNYYPLMLNLTGKKVVVIGGGKIAAQKIRTLLQSDADITVISPNIHEEVQIELSHPKLRWVQKRFEPSSDIEDAFLIVAATNVPAVNLQVHEAAKPYQLIILVDRPDLSNFIVPATIRRGKLLLSVSTGGASPGLARKLKKDLAKQFDDQYEEYLEFLERARKQILHEITDVQKKRQCLRDLLHPLFLELTRQGNDTKREAHLRALIKGEFTP